MVPADWRLVHSSIREKPPARVDDSARLEKVICMDRNDEVSVRLTIRDVDLLLEGLDAYEYWQLGDVLPRNDGAVFVPGDLDPESDRYWGPKPEPSPVQAEAIEAVRGCRGLAARLRLAINDATRS